MHSAHQCTLAVQILSQGHIWKKPLHLGSCRALPVAPCRIQNPRDPKRSQESKRHMWKKGHQNTICNFQYIILYIYIYMYIILYYIILYYIILYILSIYVFSQYTYFIIFRDHAKAMQGQQQKPAWLCLARPSSQGTCRWLQLHAWWASPRDSPAHLHRFKVTISSSFCAKDGHNLPAVTHSNPKSFICFKIMFDFLALMFSGAVTANKKLQLLKKTQHTDALVSRRMSIQV